MTDNEAKLYLRNWFLARTLYIEYPPKYSKQLELMETTPLVLDNTIKYPACYIRNRWCIKYRDNITIPNDRVLFLHERVHSLRAHLQEDFIKEVLSLKKKENYIKKAEEIYARLFELRYLNNFDPCKLYTINDIRIDVGLLKICNEEQIYKLLNNIM